MTSRRSEFTLRRRVYFYEADPAGIVHFSNYFRYMEEAEHALWREAGVTIAPREADVGFPRVAASCEYLRPLYFGDEFEVRIRVAAMSEKSLRYACTLKKDQEKIATGSVTIVCVGKREGGGMKARPIPREIADLFEVSAEDVE